MNKKNSKRVNVKLLIVTFAIIFATTTLVAQASVLDWLTGRNQTNQTYGISNAYLFANSRSAVFGGNFDNTISMSSIGESAVSQPTSLFSLTTLSSDTQPSRTMYVSATGYSSTPDQTDDSPFITAKGTYVRDGIIAANFLPFNTLVRIPEIYGDKIFVVEDRMNKRYQNRVDIWFPDRQSALEFGVRDIKIEVISSI